MRGKSIQVFKGLVGGVNLLDAPYDLKDNEARDARNVVSTLKGAIRKRDGTQFLGTPSTALQSLFGTETPEFLIGAGGTTLYSIDPTGTVVAIKTGMANAPWSFVTAPNSGAQGPVYGMNGTDAQQWDGVAATTSVWTAASGTLPSSARFLKYHSRRVWAAGMSTFAGVADPASTLVWSDIADPRVWPAENVLQLDPSDGDQITAIGTAGEQIIVFKAGKMWAVYDLDRGANRRISGDVGCVSQRSVVETPYGTFFLSRDHGVMRTNGQTVDPVSDRILPLLEQMVPAQRAKAAAAYFNDHYYLAICTTGGNNNLLLDYDLKADCWWVHSLALSDMATWEPSGDLRLYGAKAGALGVNRLFVPSLTLDDVGSNGTGGTVFSCYWSGPYHTFGKPYLNKRVRQIRFDGKGRVQVSASMDFALGSSLLGARNFSTDTGLFGVEDGGLFGKGGGTEPFGGGSDVGQARIASPGVCRSISVLFGNGTADPFEVDSYTIAVQQRSD